jgi:hypothetical protein
VIVWLWDTSGPDHDACGITADRPAAQERARACLLDDNATRAQVQAAELIAGQDVLDSYYRRFGDRWQGCLTNSGDFRWHRSRQK